MKRFTAQNSNFEQKWDIPFKIDQAAIGNFANSIPFFSQCEIVCEIDYRGFTPYLYFNKKDRMVQGQIALSGLVNHGMPILFIPKLLQDSYCRKDTPIYGLGIDRHNQECGLFLTDENLLCAKSLDQSMLAYPIFIFHFRYKR